MPVEAVKRCPVAILRFNLTSFFFSDINKTSSPKSAARERGVPCRDDFSDCSFSEGADLLFFKISVANDLRINPVTFHLHLFIDWPKNKTKRAITGEKSYLMIDV